MKLFRNESDTNRLAASGALVGREARNECVGSRIEMDERLGAHRLDDIDTGAEGRGRGVRCDVLRSDAQDRKSTRLNSSHT